MKPEQAAEYLQSVQKLCPKKIPTFKDIVGVVMNSSSNVLPSASSVAEILQKSGNKHSQQKIKIQIAPNALKVKKRIGGTNRTDYLRRKKYRSSFPETEITEKSTVVCPFCKKNIGEKSLVRHVNHYHSEELKRVKREGKKASASIIHGVEVQNANLIEEIKHRVIDESGILVNPDMLQADEHRRSRDERLQNVAVQSKRPSKPIDHSSKSAFQSIAESGNRIPGAYKGKKQLTGGSEISCPICRLPIQYSVMFVHIEVRHPHANPKIVMSRLNKLLRSNEPSERRKLEQDLNELAKEYERLRQSQDESRDGGKYLGHMRRERGKFGSLPLYDDYSDESSAE